ncbi:MAG: YHYH protein [Planctomycetota bacterium]
MTIEVRGDTRVITCNGVADHATGRFPNRNNPNAVSAQRYRFRVPVNPEMADEPVRERVLFGVALNGVPFDPGTAEYYNPETGRLQRGRPTGWNYDALSGEINLGLDRSNAHVQPTGAYHYHGLPTGLIDALRKEQGEDAGAMLLVGYAADGFPIYAEFGHKAAHDAQSAVVKLKPSYRLKRGRRPSRPEGPGGRYDGAFNEDWEYVDGLGDLDACNGRTGVTPEYPDGTYYYVLTDTFPFIPRVHRGEPDPSFRKGRGGGGGVDRGDRQRERPPGPRT